MATLIYHSGFEMGLFGEWTSATGTVSVDAATKKTGGYSCRLNPTAAQAYLTQTISTNALVIHAWLYFTTLPSSGDTYIRILQGAGTLLHGLVFKPADSKLYCEINANYNATGITITTDTWYEVNIKVITSANPHTLAITVNGSSISHSYAAGAETLTGIFVGTGSLITTDYYIDDVSVSYTAGDYPLADIRCATVANPNAAGTYSAFDTLVPGAGEAHYEDYDDPAGTAVATMDDDYVEQAGKAAVADIANLDSCADIGLAAGDVIDAVNVMIYHNGVTDGTAGIRVRSNAGTDYDTAKTIAGITWSSVYYALDPAGAAWTQTNFNGFQAGKYTASHATDEFLYCVMVFVAYTAGAALAISKVNDIAWASIGKINGVAVASISKVNGVAKP